MKRKQADWSKMNFADLRAYTMLDDWREEKNRILKLAESFMTGFNYVEFIKKINEEFGL